eukprot:GHVP01034563.1.p1 GENE.GHVP01034563.1~~GHVP01034563.1.p1  ORF type:complete len:101 (+),score=23.09 GHVP01034563.1:254-556(+)
MTVDDDLDSVIELLSDIDVNGNGENSSTDHIEEIDDIIDICSSSFLDPDDIMSDIPVICKEDDNDLSDLEGYVSIEDLINRGGAYSELGNYLIKKYLEDS